VTGVQTFALPICFAARSEVLIGRYYTFADEFQAILHRKVHTSEE